MSLVPRHLLLPSLPGYGTELVETDKFRDVSHAISLICDYISGIGYINWNLKAPALMGHLSLPIPTIETATMLY